MERVRCVHEGAEAATPGEGGAVATGLERRRHQQDRCVCLLLFPSH